MEVVVAVRISVKAVVAVTVKVVYSSMGADAIEFTGEDTRDADATDCGDEADEAS